MKKKKTHSGTKGVCGIFMVLRELEKMRGLRRCWKGRTWSKITEILQYQRKGK